MTIFFMKTILLSTYDDKTAPNNQLTPFNSGGFMKKPLLLLLVSVFLATHAFGNNLYTFEADKNWRKVEFNDKNLYELYEVSGILLKPFYNNGPLIVTIFIFNMGKAKDLDEATSIWKDTFYNDKDRKYYNQSPLGATIDAKWGLISHFYRKSKGLYQTRYEFISISPKTNDIINLTISIQHNDSSFNLVKELGLNNMADYVFSKLAISGK